MPLDTGRIKAICFDLDGTLSDTDDKWVYRLEKLLYPVRGLFPDQDTHAFSRWVIMGLETPGNLIYELLDRLHLDDEVGRLVSAISRWGKDGKDHHILIPGVDEMLASLAQRYPLAVVTSRGEQSTLEFLEHYNLRPYFQTIATALTCTYTKPFPDPINWAAAQMGVESSACLMVGDTTVDIRSGKAAGAQTVGVLCGFSSQRKLSRAGPDLIIETTALIEKYL